MLVGDSSDYSTLLQMMLNQMALPAAPESLILPALAASPGRASGVAALPESAQVCSCHSVSKGDICAAVQAGCGDMAAVKQCTRAATGCGGCSALVKQVMEHQLANLGVVVKKRYLRALPLVTPGALSPDARRRAEKLGGAAGGARARPRLRGVQTAGGVAARLLLERLPAEAGAPAAAGDQRSLLRQYPERWQLLGGAARGGR
ncbi:(2Fe-2S)-binding protein [Pantoea tagorei]